MHLKNFIYLLDFIANKSFLKFNTVKKDSTMIVIENNSSYESNCPFKEPIEIVKKVLKP